MVVKLASFQGEVSASDASKPFIGPSDLKDGEELGEAGPYLRGLPRFRFNDKDLPLLSCLFMKAVSLVLLANPATKLQANPKLVQLTHRGFDSSH